MPPSEEAAETFAAWRIWIIKTLDKLSQDVDSLKTLTNDRTEYLRRFEVVERELREVREHVSGLNIASAVSRRTLAIYSALAAFAGSVATALAGKLL